ncbi:hypothetical protein SAMN05216573_102480 [Bradyrhizobium sp. Rc3b]|uniref:hypothetical protein n=1 Tax=unclassified Bradyrhizobium TaxID=2631580 RepID=UPI0008EAC553|nr:MULTISPECIES: hypothetical protein [unclassified Bradyrhizobium]MBB4381084.1 hypothetical protein [Bradyrhizobium sp. SBR1B]SFM55442.1 hypothetical protein SAMN05216573_102480 [Bradyrhizobium sp. Rc3b]
MACSRGAASPDAHTQRRLFAASGGYCQNPECARELFVEYDKKFFHVAEMAHVFAANDFGPRANAELSAEDRGAFENLILLCSLCHTKIDKVPEVYTDRVVSGWKRVHAEKLRSLFGVTVFAKRADARAAIEGLLRENHYIFEEYGPQIEAAQNPESGAAERWRRKVLEKIIPNNMRVLAQVDANRHLLGGDEADTVEKFRQHVDDLQARHLHGYQEGATRFPAEMAELLRD